MVSTWKSRRVENFRRRQALLRRNQMYLSAAPGGDVEEVPEPGHSNDELSLSGGAPDNGSSGCTESSAGYGTDRGDLPDAGRAGLLPWSDGYRSEVEGRWREQRLRSVYGPNWERIAAIPPFRPDSGGDSRPPSRSPPPVPPPEADLPRLDPFSPPGPYWQSGPSAPGWAPGMPTASSVRAAVALPPETEGERVRRENQMRAVHGPDWRGRLGERTVRPAPGERVARLAVVPSVPIPTAPEDHMVDLESRWQEALGRGQPDVGIRRPLRAGQGDVGVGVDLLVLPPRPSAPHLASLSSRDLAMRTDEDEPPAYESPPAYSECFF